MGARPQFVKVSPVHKALSKRHEHVIMHTGQHYDYQMSQVFFEELDIPKPDHYLGIGSGSHGVQTGRMLSSIEEVLIRDRPDWVLVYGDTNSTLAGALASAKLGIPIAHVEAGLRSYRKGMPEEINRVLTDHASNLLLCPSQVSVDNLKKEGIEKGVHMVGDTMTEVLLTIEDRLKNDVLDTLGVKKREYVLCTIHRQENADDIRNMESIIDAIVTSGLTFIIPLHPRTRKNLSGWNMIDRLERAKNVILTEPMNFMDFTTLEKNAYKIMTDSGGVQKEAYFFKVPCVTIRDETEWVTLEDGWNELTGVDKGLIERSLLKPEPSSPQRTIYGDASVSERIVKAIESTM